MSKTALTRWSELDGERSTFLSRCEEYSALTIPKVCPPIGWNQTQDELNHDMQSVGAQAVNHLTNKLMLTLFSPTRPFVRFDASDEIIAGFAQMGVDEQKVQEILANGERKAMKEMDKRSLRPKLNETVKHLIVVGNVLLILDGKKPRVVPLRNYVCKRNAEGSVLELIVKDVITVDQLDKKIRESEICANKQDSEKVDHYRWIVRDENGDYRMTQWVNGDKLPKEFDGKWAEERMPYRALTWDLADNADYGTGHVEDYAGDFRALSVLSKASVTSAILSSEFRWLANPNGFTKPEDLEQSANGAVLPGQQGDITLVNSGTPSALQFIQIHIQDYVNRIGRGFLLASAVTRNAERVTAEEIRLQATELETSLGGAYSRIAVDLQVPFAYFLMDLIDLKFKGKQIEPVIVTGMDALSRNGDLDNLLSWLGDLARVQSLNPRFPILSVLRLDTVASALAAARGVDSTKFMQPPEVLQQAMQQLQQQEAMAAAQGGQAPGQPPADPATIQ